MTQINELLNELLAGAIEAPSDQQKALLLDHREEAIACLIAGFAQEMPLLLQEGVCENPIAVLWGFRLAGFLEASEVFVWLRKLIHVPMDVLEEVFDPEFITEELPHILNATMRQWRELAVEIEEPPIHEIMQNVCLDALTYSVAQGRAERSQVMEYFRSLFHRILSGELEEDEFCSELVACCMDLWPGECLEEIREMFGLDLIDEDYIGLDDVLESYLQGKEDCEQKLRKMAKKHDFFRNFLSELSLSDERWDKLLNVVDQAKKDSESIFKEFFGNEPQRNGSCSCGSGKKYKKCCLNKPSSLEVPSRVRIEESIITYEPLEPSGDLKLLSEEEREEIYSLYYLVEEAPEKVLEKALIFREKYPNIPMVCNYLYGAYSKLGYSREAMSVMKDTVQKFPDYLFGRIEYALYLLRRGEPEKAYAALNCAGTLSQLYPDRKVFHAIEWKSFSYVLTRYWIEKKDVGQAKIYFNILKKVAPKGKEVEDIQIKIKKMLFDQELDRHSALSSASSS